MMFDEGWSVQKVADPPPELGGLRTIQRYRTEWLRAKLTPEPRGFEHDPDQMADVCCRGVVVGAARPPGAGRRWDSVLGFVRRIEWPEGARGCRQTLATAGGWFCFWKAATCGFSPKAPTLAHSRYSSFSVPASTSASTRVADAGSSGWDSASVTFFQRPSLSFVTCPLFLSRSRVE